MQKLQPRLLLNSILSMPLCIGKNAEPRGKRENWNDCWCDFDASLLLANMPELDCPSSHFVEQSNQPRETRMSDLSSQPREVWKQPGAGRRKAR
jgi:hypothetical protein